MFIVCQKNAAVNPFCWENGGKCCGDDIAEGGEEHSPLQSDIINTSCRGRRPRRPVSPQLLLHFRRGRCPCCGAQNFRAALRRTPPILTAATRSLRFFCHWQRSVCSPHRPAPPQLPAVRRAAYPHAAVMVWRLSGGGLRADRPTDGL